MVRTEVRYLGWKLKADGRAAGLLCFSDNSQGLAVKCHSMQANLGQSDFDSQVGNLNLSSLGVCMSNNLFILFWSLIYLFTFLNARVSTG